MLTAKREAEHREHKFMAALKGVDLDADAKNDAQERFDEVQRRVETKLHGEQAVANKEYDFFGLDIETEEE